MLSTKEIREMAVASQLRLLEHGDPFSGDDWALHQVIASYLLQNPADDEDQITGEWPKKLRVRRDVRLLEWALSPFIEYVVGH